MSDWWVADEKGNILVQAFPSHPRGVIGCGVGDGRQSALVWLTPKQAREWAAILMRAAEVAAPEGEDNATQVPG